MVLSPAVAYLWLIILAHTAAKANAAAGTSTATAPSEVSEQDQLLRLRAAARSARAPQATASFCCAPQSCAPTGESGTCASVEIAGVCGGRGQPCISNDKARSWWRRALAWLWDAATGHRPDLGRPWYSSKWLLLRVPVAAVVAWHQVRMSYVERIHQGALQLTVVANMTPKPAIPPQPRLAMLACRSSPSTR